MIDKEIFQMSIDRKLKRNFSDSEDEDFSLQIPGKKKKICLDSGSESESGYVDKNIERNGEESEATSHEDEPLKNKTENSKVDTSDSISDDEPLAAKNKSSNIYSYGSEISSVTANGISKEDTSDDDNPISKIAKRKGSELQNKSKMENSDSSEDEPLAKKYSKSSENSNQSITKALDSDSDDEPLATFGKGKISPKATSTNLEEHSSDSSEDERLANKHRKSSVSSNDQSITKELHSESEDEFVATSNKGKSRKTTTSAKLEAANNSASDSEDDFLTVKNKSLKKKSNKTKNKNQSVLNGVETSSDEDEPIGKICRTSKDKGKRHKKHPSSGCSDDEPLATKVTANKKQKSQDSSGLSSDDEEKPLSSVSKTSKQKVKKKVGKKHHSSSSSDDEPLAAKITTNKKQESQDSSDLSSDDEEKPLSNVSKISKQKVKKKVGKKHHSSSSSDDEPLATKITANKKQKTQDSSDLSSDDETKPLSSVSKISKQKVNKKVGKDKTPPNGKIEHLKKYLRVAGIHVQSYDKLFENCKSIKSKVEKLLGLLHEKGLKGRPSIEKCKKLKKKIETKKEIAELDISNIIKSEGRPKRGSSGKTEKLLNTENSPAGKKFMRLRDIIDSEESD